MDNIAVVVCVIVSVSGEDFDFDVIYESGEYARGKSDKSMEDTVF